MFPEIGKHPRSEYYINYHYELIANIWPASGDESNKSLYSM